MIENLKHLEVKNLGIINGGNNEVLLDFESEGLLECVGPTSTRACNPGNMYYGRQHVS